MVWFVWLLQCGNLNRRCAMVESGVFVIRLWCGDL